jgi:hypothetical protein
MIFLNISGVEKMRKENRSGVEIEIYELGDGVERGIITNWPVEPFVFYTDSGTKALTREFVPIIVGSTIGKAFDREPGKLGAFREALHDRRPGGDIDIEQVVHPVVAMAAKFGEFGGFDAANYPKAVECINWYLEKDGIGFRTTDNPEHIRKAVDGNYLRTVPVDGTTAYFPTRDSVRAMCDTPFERMDYMLGLHTGVQFCQTANRRVRG